jgi:hypothetical protein
VNDLVEREFALLERTANGGRFTALEIEQRLRDLGIRESTSPPSIPESGWEIVLDDGSGTARLSLPLWQSGRMTNIAIEISQRVGPQGTHVTTIEDIGVKTRSLSNAVTPEQLAEELRRQDAAAAAEHHRALARMQELRVSPPPDLPEQVRALVQPILQRLVQGEFQQLWTESGEQGVPPDVMSEALARIGEPIVVPPQGLPPDTECFEHTDGFVVEVPLWTSQVETSTTAVVEVLRGRDGSLTAHVYDLKLT